jgi:hypothetical protein
MPSQPVLFRPSSPGNEKGSNGWVVHCCPLSHFLHTVASRSGDSRLDRRTPKTSRCDFVGQAFQPAIFFETQIRQAGKPAPPSAVRTLRPLRLCGGTSSVVFLVSPCVFQALFHRGQIRIPLDEPIPPLSKGECRRSLWEPCSNTPQKTPLERGIEKKPQEDSFRGIPARPFISSGCAPRARSGSHRAPPRRREPFWMPRSTH